MVYYYSLVYWQKILAYCTLGKELTLTFLGMLTSKTGMWAIFLVFTDMPAK